MKTLVEPKDLTRDVLVNLLCTATYGNSDLHIECDKDGLDLEYGDCKEDVWAKALLAMKKIRAVDLCAEGEKYADSAYFDEDEAVYPLTIEDIRNGLEKAINGDFKSDSDSEKKWIRNSALSILENDGEADLSDAWAVMQVIMFNEVIYG